MQVLKWGEHCETKKGVRKECFKKKKLPYYAKAQSRSYGATTKKDSSIAVEKLFFETDELRRQFLNHYGPVKSTLNYGLEACGKLRKR